MLDPPKSKIRREPEPHDPFNPHGSDVLDIDYGYGPHDHHVKKDEINMFSPNHFREVGKDINMWEGHYSPDDWNHPSIPKRTNLTFNQ
jgi:hypothetical protein